MQNITSVVYILGSESDSSQYISNSPDKNFSNELTLAKNIQQKYKLPETFQIVFYAQLNQQNCIIRKTYSQNTLISSNNDVYIEHLQLLEIESKFFYKQIICINESLTSLIEEWKSFYQNDNFNKYEICTFPSITNLQIKNRRSSTNKWSRNDVYDKQEKFQKKSKFTIFQRVLDLDFYDRIKRTNHPVLVIGERGTGKTTIVNNLAKSQGKKIVHVTCGSISDDIAESEFLGYKKGAFTGAAVDKNGFLKMAEDGILFLDELQDMSPKVQRIIITALENKQYYPLGATENQIEKTNFRLICGSNRKPEELINIIHPDLWDRITCFTTSTKSLKEYSKNDFKELWAILWENYFTENPNKNIPSSPDDYFEYIYDEIKEINLYGNMRDLNKLLAYIDIYVYDKEHNTITQSQRNEKLVAYKTAINFWKNDILIRNNAYENSSNFIQEHSDQFLMNLIDSKKWNGLLRLFKKWLSEKSKELYGSKTNAAQHLAVDKKSVSQALDDTITI